VSVAGVLQALGGPEVVAQWLAVAWLLAARLSPLSLLVPWIAVRGAPLSWSLPVTAALTLALSPLAVASAVPITHAPAGLLLLSLREVAVGAVYAAAVGLPLHALDWGGRVVDRVRGLPGGASGPFGQLYLWLGLCAFFALGGHRLAIAALAEGLAQAPIGLVQPVADPSVLALGVLRLTASALESAVLIATPVLAAVALSELALAAAMRAAPALPPHWLLSPVRAAVPLLVVWIGAAWLLASLPAVFRAGIDAAARLMDAL